MHSGDYDGGRGPSQPLRQKRKAETDVQRANEIDRDIIEYEADMSMTEEAGCKPPKKINCKKQIICKQVG